MPRLTLIVSFVNLLILCLFISYYFSQSSSQIAYVDSNKLVNGYKGMQKARQEYEQKTAVWKANIDTLVSEVKDQIMEYEKGAARMTDRERKLSQELIRTKQQQLEEYQQAMNLKAQEEDRQMTANVLSQVNAYITRYGKDKGYRLILATTDFGNIAYANEALDLTEEILEGLNEQYVGK
ncbi:MAG: OmpH family outer membrane protein [Cyclobacteriaceae bacterium]|jgi:outer membrane protein